MANDNAAAFGETGQGYWQYGVQCLRAEGENRPSRPGNVVAWPDVARTLAARHDSSPCIDREQNFIVSGFMAGQGAKAGGIGYQEEVSPTLKSSESGGNTVPTVVAFEKYRHSKYREGMGTLRANGGDCGGGSENLMCAAHGQGGAEICNDLTPTLNCNHEQPYIAGRKYRVRRLTPIECERLMGFPDGWTEFGISAAKYAKSLKRGEKHTGLPEDVLLCKISDSKRYAAIGNSVAIPCVDYIMAGIVEAVNHSPS